MSENPFERWAVGGKKSVDIDEITNFVSGVRGSLVTLRNPWSNDDLRMAVEKKYGTDEIALMGRARVVRGEKLAVALNSAQFEVMSALYDIDPGLHAIMQESQATVSDETEKKVESARLVWVTRPETDEIIISQGLARKLEITQGQIIKILTAGTNLADLDLDDYPTR